MRIHLRQALGLLRIVTYVFSIVLLFTATGLPAATTIVVGENASSPERVAGQELSKYLQQLYAQEQFRVMNQAPQEGKRIRFAVDLQPAERFEIRATANEAIIAGGSPPALLFGVYALLEKLGCGFYLSYDTVPAPRKEPFSFEQWKLADEPLAPDRIIFNWHNFLSGCTGWNLADWEKWIIQSQKMRYNTVMVHAYGNNPMFTYTFNGKAKPVGYLSSTAQGRDWGTEHVNDVRRLVGGHVFSNAIFGADAALAPEEQRAEAAQGLMKKVFATAANRGMHIIFALDVDTESSNPQDIILTLPDSARFKTGNRWVAAPDTSEGYAYYKNQAETLLKLYPQIDRLAIWIRTGNTVWTQIKRDELPPRWQKEFDERLTKEPELAKLPLAPGRFALGKVIAAFQKALGELGRGDIRLLTGSWSFDWMHAADPFYPPGIPFLPLDYAVLKGASELDTPARRAVTRQLAERRPVVPIVWAHHDDGTYLGRSFTPYEDFASRLNDCGAKSFGIIHWTTRPLEVYFKSLAVQVWSSTKEQPLRLTCADIAERCFGRAARERGGEYLDAWVTGAPTFSRETSDFFMDRPVAPELVRQVIALSEDRVKALQGVEAPGAEYWRAYENFAQLFFQTEGLYQEACASLKNGDFSTLRQAVEKAKPEGVIEQYVRACKVGSMTRSEQGSVVSMNLRWLPYFISLRQALALEPVRIKYGPTRHEPLAQGAGRLSWHVDSDKKFWRLLGQKETGASTFEAPVVSNELYRSGILRTGPFKLEIRPFLHDMGRNTPNKLRPGKYRLKLLVLEEAEKPGELVYPVTVGATGIATVQIERDQTRLCAALLEAAGD